VPATIVTRAPTRIDFGGGWTDVPPYSDEVGGFVCNVAIARYATARVHALDDPNHTSRVTTGRASDRNIADACARRLGVGGVEIGIHSDFPIGAGLGGSSAASVAAIAALAARQSRSIDPSALAELSREVEIDDLGIAGGRQDHYAAAYGGALGLRFSASGTTVQRIPLSDETRAALERRCAIVYTGQSRISGDTITAVLDAYRAGEPRVLLALRRMRELAEEMAVALEQGDVDALSSLVGEQWSHQRSLHPAIPTPLIDRIVATAGEAGATGSKALGASGGGCVLVMAPDDRIDAVRAGVSRLGEMLPFTIDVRGVTTCE
jgi:D-glycero-alpha-D-manno-heptose-7-phosphate kinase